MVQMLRLTRESVYRGSLIQIYERPSRTGLGIEQVVLIDWMDVTSASVVLRDPAASERRARDLVDEFLMSLRDAPRNAQTLGRAA
jgi:hypothetical protein